MSTQVKKTKSGIDYLYLQRSYRDGTGKVVTKHEQYIGPCSVYGYPNNTSKRPPKKILVREPSNKPTVVDNKPNLDETHREESGLKNNQSNLILPPWLETKKKIRSTDLHKSQATLSARLKNKGCNLKGSIRVKNGKRLQSGKTRKGYTVYVPKKKQVSRNAILHEIHRSQALLALKALKQSDRDSYDAIKRHFKKAQKARNEALGRWCVTTRGRDRMANSVRMSRWGDGSALRGINGRDEDFGLVERRKYKNWRDEFASIYGKMTTQGKTSDGRNQYTRDISKSWGKAEVAVTALSDRNVKEWRSKKVKKVVMIRRKKNMGLRLRTWKKATRVGPLREKKALGIRRVKRVGYQRVKSRWRKSSSNRRRELKGAKCKQESVKQLYRCVKIVETSLSL
jgi:hypothetical protein